MKTKRKHRLLSILLTLSLLAGVTPATEAQAAETDTAPPPAASEVPVEPPEETLAKTPAQRSVTQLTERIQTGQPGETITGDKVMIINNSDNYQYTAALPACKTPGAESTPASDFTREARQAEMADPGTGRTARITYTRGQKDSISGVDCTFLAEGEHCYIWMRDDILAYYGDDIAAKWAQDFINVYDKQSYYYIINACTDTSVEGWTDPIPYRDGSGKCHIVLGNDSGSAGYYAPFETEKTAFHITIPVSQYNSYTASNCRDLLVHEAQHLLLDHFNPTATGKVRNGNEGLAVSLAMYMRGNSDWLGGLDTNINIRNGQWSLLKATSDSTQDYNFHYLFFRYLITQFAGQDGKTFNTSGIDSAVFRFFRTLYGREDDGKDFDAFLAACGIRGIGSFDEAVPAFYLALAAQESEGKYGFYDDPVFYSGFSSFPVYYAKAGQKVNIAPRAAILIEPENGQFVVPSDGGAGLTYYAITDKAKQPEGPKKGTAENPYLISTENEFFAINQDSDACYKMTADIELKADSTVWFDGTLDGDGHTIRCLSGRSPIQMNNGTVRNVRFEVSGEASKATAFIKQNYGLVEDCTLTGTAVFSSDKFGTPAALVDDNGGSIQRCTVDAEVTYAAGSAGYTAADLPFALLCGKNESWASISDCLVAGRLTLTGGFSGTPLIGALAGLDEGEVSRCVCVAKVETGGASLSGDGACGIVSGRKSNNAFTDCYYLEDGNRTSVGAGDATGLTAVSAGSLTNKATFSALDFTTIWSMGEKHPVLNSEEERLAKVDSVEVQMISASMYLGESPDLSRKAKLIINGSASVAVTNDMVDLTPLYDMKAAGNVELHGVYGNKPFSFTLNVTVPEVTALTVSSAGTTKFVVGQTYSPDGVKLKVNFPYGYYYITYGFTADLAGRALTASDTQVTLSYGGRTAPISIRVSGRAVESLTVLRGCKIAYEVGEIPDLSDMMLELHFDNGDVEYTTYTEGKTTYDLRLFGTPPRRASLPPITWSEAETWVRTPVKKDHDGYTLYVFAGDPGSEYVTKAADSLGILQVGYRTVFQLTCEDGTPFSSDETFNEKRGLTKEEALNQRTPDIAPTPGEQNGVTGTYKLKEWKSEADDENRIVYYTGVMTFVPDQLTGDGYTIDYIAETITVEAGFEAATAQTGGTAVTSGSVTEYLGRTIYIRAVGGDSWTAIDIAARPAAPDGLTKAEETVKNKKDAVLSGVDTTMEYSMDSGATWTDVDRETIENPENKPISVRVKATGRAPHGEAAEFMFPASETLITVTFDLNGGDGTAPDPQQVAYGETLTEPDPAPEKEGCIFKGWYTDAGSTKWNFADSVEETMTLTAQWKEPGTVTITYTASDGGSVTPTSEEVNSVTGTAQGSTAQADEGYHFVNWTDESGSEMSSDAAFIPERPAEGYDTVTYKANFAGNSYTVRFDASGGRGTMNDQTFTYGKEQALRTSAFEKSGYLFGGWATSEERAAGGTVDYADREAVKNLTAEENGTVTLYAVWNVEQHTHSLTYVPGKEATCTEPGNTEYYQCDCGRWYEDGTGIVEITDKSSVVIPATGHRLSEWDYETARHWKECEVCGEILERAAHVYGSGNTCHVCGYKKKSPSVTRSRGDAEVAIGSVTSTVPSASASGNGYSGGEWSMVDGKWVYVLPNGTWGSGGWMYLYNPSSPDKTKGGWFCFDDKGALRSGWVQAPDGGWYFCNSGNDGNFGKMENGWHSDTADGNTYYMDPVTGRMQTGWKQIDGKWYYFATENDVPRGNRTENGVQNQPGARSHGAMYRNEKTPDGYTVDENGVWIP